MPDTAPQWNCQALAQLVDEKSAMQEPGAGIVLHRVDEGKDRAFGYNAATREYGDLLQMGVIDPAKVTRLALQNAGSIASLILTTDCMIANAPPKAASQPNLPAQMGPEF